MKHRKLARFVGLTAASLVSLALGAFLSYEASVAQDAGSFSAGHFSAQADAADHPVVAKLVAVALATGVEARADARLSESPLSPDHAEQAFSASSKLLAPLTLTLRGDVAPVDQVAPAPPPAPVHQAALAPQAPVALAAPAVEADHDAEDPVALFNGRPAPLPPLRPAGLIAVVDAALPPAPIAPAQAEVKPSPLEVKPPQLALAAPQPAANPPPQAGAAAAETPNAALSPVTQAAALASQVAALAHQAAPVSPAPSTAPAAAPNASPAAVARSGPVAPAAPASQNGFPNITGALAAVTASVGGANAAVTPAAPAPQQAMLEPDTGNFKKGSPVFVRIFKREGVLELWLKQGDRFALYKSYPICKWSGQLGPKTRSADYQSPEGFYSVSARQLNPNSHYHLAFDVGYPNAYDRRQGSTGNAVMVHGDCKSVGCFAMTNNGIDEIYAIVAAALASGQREVPVHIFPFRMTEQAIVEASAPKQVFAFLASPAPTPQRDWSAFWRNLKEGYDAFERTRQPPTAFACGDRYEFNGAGRSCARIAGW